MNILVTGAAGYIGSVVTELLLEVGNKVIGVDNFLEGKPEAVNNNIKFYEGNFGSPELIKKIFTENKPEIVFHFAAETTIEHSMTNPYAYFSNNVVNGLNLLECMRESGCKDIIFSSTAATYGEPVQVPISETHPQIPINAYGESKLIFEKILEWYYKSYGFRYNLFRYFNASGATEINGEDRKHESHLLPLIFRKINDPDLTLKVYGNDYPTKDGTCIRDYVHVLDIANAHILGIKNLDINPNGKYNLGSGEGHSILDVIETIEKVTGEKINWEYAPRRIGDPAVLVASNSLAKSELKWNPDNSSLKNIIETAYLWAKKNPNGYKQPNN